ncbi:hypothetical protein [Morganella morganii]|uniref:hypothetical protein n=1 Tax=Morganella morganii TaxID=582 RepID=UPI000907C88C|nr:hypothetical protein [Morganella morganii]
MTKIFKIPFATQGDRTAVPDDVQADGSLSYTQGYGYDYERDQATDPAAKDIEREKMNSIFHDITGAVGEIQAFGMPVWAEEGKPYAIRSVVYHNKKVWQSKIENNNTEPAAGVAWTELKADVTAEDVGAYTKVEANLKFQPVGNYADKNEVNGKLAKDQNGADIQDKEKFIENLGLPEKYQPKGNYQPAGDYPLTSSVFGIGQKWYGMTTQRKLETVYKNNTGKGIYIAVCLASDGIAGLVSMKMYVDDVPVGTNQVQVLGEKGRYTYATVATFVPAGSSYYLTVPAAESQLNINSWSEMR